MNTDGTGFHTCKECHKTESLWNHTTTEHKKGEQLEDRRSVGANSSNSGDGTDQRVQFLMFMMMMMMWWQYLQSLLAKCVKPFVVVKVQFNGLVKQQYHNWWCNWWLIKPVQMFLFTPTAREIICMGIVCDMWQLELLSRVLVTLLPAMSVLLSLQHP